MKKTIFIIAFFGTLIISGCNEQNLLNNIGGEWHVQKYLEDGKDKTRWFDTSHVNFKWYFSGKTFTQTWQTITTVTETNYDSIGHFSQASQTWILDSVTTSQSVIPVDYQLLIKGTWLLTNGNQFIQAMDSTTGTKLYQIMDHSSSGLHLMQGNAEYYLAK